MQEEFIAAFIDQQKGIQNDSEAVEASISTATAPSMDTISADYRWFPEPFWNCWKIHPSWSIGVERCLAHPMAPYSIESALGSEMLLIPIVSAFITYCTHQTELNLQEDWTLDLVICCCGSCMTMKIAGSADLG